VHLTKQISQDKQCTYKRNDEALSSSHRWNKYYIFCVCVCVSSRSILAAMNGPCATLCCHLRPIRFYHIFLYYFIHGKILGKTLLNIKCMFWLHLELLSKTFLILAVAERDMIKNVHRFTCEVLSSLSDFNETWLFSTNFPKIFKHKISWKSLQWEPSLSMRTDKLIWRC